MMWLSGSAAVVSGGTSGIGLALAHELVARGARVAITGTNTAKLEAALATFPISHDVLPLRFDVSDEAAWRDAAARTIDRFGPIRFLALNAGIGAGGDLVEDTPAEVWNWAWRVNVMGVVHGLRACVPAMRAGGDACHVLVTSSIAGVWRCPTVGPYLVSKAAVVALAEALRLELAGTSIRTSVLLPGAVRTSLPETSQRAAPVEMTPQLLRDMHSVVDAGLEPADVARHALTRIADGAFYVFTHPQGDDEIARRQSELADAMRFTVRS